MKYKLQKCKTRDEFFNLTKDWYGVGLTFTGSVPGASYEITQRESWYSGISKRDKELGRYDGLKPILISTFGELSCGGVAASHYGQYKVVGYRTAKRLKKLYSSTLSPQFQEILHKYPIEAMARLPKTG